MQIIIPMAGRGERFLKAGYTAPKPLVEVDGKPIIQRIVNMFPGENNFHFICNRDHINRTPIKETLQEISPGGTVHAIDPHKKGPVFSVNEAMHCVEEGEVIVNYCDFGWSWDYKNFLKHTRARKADGAIPCYKGFHPHMLGEQNYAFLRAEKQWALEIREKQPFTKNRMNEHASSGTYYFQKGSYVRKYFSELIKQNIAVENEYYVSMAYNLMIKDGLKTSVYEIQHMLQWGAPEDLENYQSWSDYFKERTKIKTKRKQIKGAALMPMAGRSERFSVGEEPAVKPMIKVDGEPMFIRAARHAPKMDRWTFVCLREHAEKLPVRQEIEKFSPGAEIITLERHTDGQAATCAIATQTWAGANPVMIVACDNGMLWDEEKFETLASDGSVDAVVWTFRNHPSAKRNPEMYGWVRADETGRAIEISVKKPVSGDPGNDHAIVGAFYFRSPEIFNESLMRVAAKNDRVNNELYVDSVARELVLTGRNVKVFEVDYYICWGTPEDLKTYEYWQSYFHKCEHHPYNLMGDTSINQQEAKALHDKYISFKQSFE